MVALVDANPESRDSRFRLRHVQSLMKETSLEGALSFSSTTFQHLAGAICGCNPEDISLGLPPGSAAPHASYVDVAQAIVLCSSPGTARRAMAPFLKGGMALTVFKSIFLVVNEHFFQNTSETERYLTVVIAEVFKLYKFMTIPWEQSGSGRRKLASWDFWALLNTPEQTNVRRREQETEEEEEDRHLVLLSNRLSAEDPSAVWKVSHISLKSIEKLLSKQTPPKFTQPFIRPSNEDYKEMYVWKTYDWVNESYDYRKPSHQLALLVAVMLAKLNPSITYNKDAHKQHLGRLKNAKEARDALDKLTWEKQKGLSWNDSDGLATGFLTLAIALMEEESPLRQHMALSSTQAMGQLWHNKHS